LFKLLFLKELRKSTIFSEQHRLMITKLINKKRK